MTDQATISRLWRDGRRAKSEAKSQRKTTHFRVGFLWLPFIHAVRTEHYKYDPLRMRQIRELVDDFEAGNLELQEKSHANA